VAAKNICDELKKNRYVISYLPSSAPFGETRSLLVLGDEGITVRAKTAQQRIEVELPYHTFIRRLHRLRKFK